MIDAVAAFVHPPLHDSTLRTIRDPDDEPNLQTAVVGKADVLCTLDRHFQTPEVRAYLAAHAIRALTDVALLRELRPPSPETPVA